MKFLYFFILSIIFILFEGAIFLLSPKKDYFNTTMLFLHLVNFVLFLLNLIAYHLHTKALNAKNNFEFITKTISVTALRIITIIVLIVGFVLGVKQSINLVSIFSTMLFYFVYTFTEIFFLLKKRQD